MIRLTPQQIDKLELINKLSLNIDNLNDDDLLIIQKMIDKGYNSSVNYGLPCNDVIKPINPQKVWY